MNLFDRAKTLLQSRSPTTPTGDQYYHVSCPAGHRLSGKRTEGYQALRCPTCGEGIFVLPRSPLPEPPAPAQRQAPRPAPEFAPPVEDDPISLTDPIASDNSGEATAFGEVEIDWEESATSPATQAPATELAEETDRAGDRVRSGVSPARARATGVKPNPQPTGDARVRERTNPSRKRPAAAPGAPPSPARTAPFRPSEWARRHRNPLIFLGVVAVVLGTFALQARRARFETYPRIAERGRTEGLAALDQGRFDTAYHLLSEAKRAVDALGGKCEGAVDILRGAREAEVFATLVSESLETMIEEANPSETSSWPGRFDTLYKGRSILIDAHVVAVPGEGGATGYDLDYRIFPAGEGGDRVRRGRLDVAHFPLFEQVQVKAGTRVLFGARLASFTLDVESDEWVAGLEPDSGVFITHHDALKALWPASEELPGEKQP